MREVLMAECGDSIKTLFFNCGGLVPVEIEIPKDYRAYNGLIGAETGTVVDLNWVRGSPGCDRNYAIWLDDEGLLRRRPMNPMVMGLASRDGQLRSPLVGCGMLLVTDDDGETQSVNFEEMRQIVRASVLTREQIDEMVQSLLKAAS